MIPQAGTPGTHLVPPVDASKVEVKRYYARVAGSRFVFSDGQELIFAYGFADVAEKGKQKELDVILGKNPNIFAQNVLPEVLPEVPQNAKAELEIIATDKNINAAIASGVITGKVSGEINDGPVTIASDPNASTLDPELQRSLAAAAAASNNNAAVAKAIADAKARASGSAGSVG